MPDPNDLISGDEDFDADPDGADDLSTDIQRSPARYPQTALVHGVEVRWKDSRGPHVIELDGPTVIGSASDSGIAVSDPAVSRIHAELDPRADGLWLRDLGSRNGTFIEGIQVVIGRVPDGATLTVGSTPLTVQQRTTRASAGLWPDDRLGRLLGKSVAMRALFARLHQVSRNESTVLIQGETGTGKELVGMTIHEQSPRAMKPYVVVDCAALPESLLDAELFGHTRGAFTGAVSARVGAIESAEGGTVFLDEIGELPLSLQPKLLRALESRAIRRVGETAPRPVNVRIP